MDKSALIIEMPKLSNESVAAIRDFLESVLYAFDAHYLNQLRAHYRSLSLDDKIDF